MSKPFGSRRGLNRQRGFTLIEIMVVVVILGILAAFVVPNVLQNPEKARAVKARHDLRAIENALDMYYVDNFHYPSTDQGLKALVEEPNGEPEAKNWKQGGYLKSLPEDPWGHEYKYLSPDDAGGRPKVFTLGADNQTGGSGANKDVSNLDLK